MDEGKILLLYHFCRLQLSSIVLSATAYEHSLRRMFDLYRTKHSEATWQQYLAGLSPLDVFLVCGCLAKDAKAWELLFAARAGRADRLLVDALRARAMRLYPRNEEKQESVMADFWGRLLVAETAESTPILARYDGQRPLIPWLIRIFQNWQISRLRSKQGKAEPLAEGDLLGGHDGCGDANSRWHESFCEAAREWLGELSDQDMLLLGLRVRYRMSQREAADLLGVHEGTISRQITQLRDRCLEFIGQRLVREGWEGDDLSEFVHDEMAALLTDEPRLSADNLARLLAARGKRPPE